MRSEPQSTILLVEDNADEELLVMRSLRRMNGTFQVLTAHSTDEALGYLRCTGPFEGRDTGNPDVILTDYRIGPMGGAELVSAIRSDPGTRLIPIVVMSSAASSGQIDDLYRRGANSFLEKALDSDEFCRNIQTAVRYWGSLNATAWKSPRLSGRPYTL